MSLRPAPRDLLLLGLLTVAAILLHGYHVGVQDQAIYLPAVKKLLQPDLYPHDAEFFVSQTRWALFDEAIAAGARLTGSLEWVMLAAQVLTVFLVLLGCLRVVRCCFTEPAAQWAGVGLVAAMLILPATGTQTPMVDNYLHPRGLATAAILLAWPAALAGRLWWLAGIFAAAPFHPVMALIGGFHLAVQWWKAPREAGREASPLLMALPLLAFAALLQPEGDAWREVLESRRDIFLLRWTWYEWIGVIVPVAFLWWMWRHSRSRAPVRAHVASRLLVVTGCAAAGAIVVSTVPGLERLMLGQPMRALHVVYIFFFLLVGGWLGQALLRARWIRWAAFFVPVCAVMFYVQLRTFDGSSHFDWPGVAPRNGWVQAFVWMRDNTPRDALVALDPEYMRRPGQDYFGFRALAERSMLADTVKDRAVVVLTPSLADTWRRQLRSRDGWRRFQRADFQRLAAEFGVTWVVVERPAPAGMDCRYANDVVSVCKVE